jgi:predicted PurR-regulated permease PerM
MSTSTPPPAAPKPAPAAPDWRTLHLWQIQPLRDTLIILAVLAVLYLGWVLSVVTVPLLLAMALAYLFEPLVKRLTALGWVSRQGAAVAIILGAVLVIVVPAVTALGFAVLEGASFAQRFGSNARRLATAVETPGDPSARAALPSEAWRSMADRLVRVREQAERARKLQEERRVQREAAKPPEEAGDAAAGEAAAPPELSRSDVTALQTYDAFQWAVKWVGENSQAIGKQAISTGAGAIEVGARWLLRLGFVVFGGFLTAFFFYFFCTGYGKVIAFWESLIPERRKSLTINLFTRMDAVISGFIRGRLIITAIFMVYYTVAYVLIGVPTPLLLGPIIGALALVPYATAVGVPISMALLYLTPAAVSWQNEWWWVVGAPLLVSVGAQILDDYILTPTIQGKSTGMDTPTILFASLAGGVLAGFYGLLLAIPVAACLKIVLREVVWPRFRAWAEGRARDPLPVSNK